MRTTNENKPPEGEAALEIKIAIPGIPNLFGSDISGESVSLVTSLAPRAEIDREPDDVVAEVVDIFGSAVAESTGWRPRESQDMSQ